MVSVDIKLDGPKKKLSQQNVQQGQYAMSNQALADMNQFVPMDQGILRNTGSLGIDGKSVSWHTPYAKRKFYEPMYNYTTPGTGPRWDIKAKRIFIKDWVNAFQKGAGW